MPESWVRSLPNQGLPYTASYYSLPIDYDWLVLDLVRLQDLACRFLVRIPERYRPVFADDRQQVLVLSAKSLSAINSPLKVLYRRRARHLASFLPDVIALQEIRELAALPLWALKVISRRAATCDYVGDRTLLARVLAKYHLYLDCRDTGVAARLQTNGYWEPALTYFFCQQIQPGWRCLDVGANLGYFTTLMADLTGPTGKVWAIEPNLRLFALMTRSLHMNCLISRVELSSSAIAEVSGKPVTLLAPREAWLNNVGGATIMDALEYDDQGNPLRLISETFTTTVDELTQGQSVQFMKIDVEGAEYLVWKGMQETLQQSPDLTIALEVASGRNYDLGGFLDEIYQAGFTIQQFAKAGKLVPVNRDEFLASAPGITLLILQRGQHSSSARNSKPSL